MARSSSMKTAREQPPALLMSLNWLGATDAANERARLLASHGYVVFVADRYGETSGPRISARPLRSPIRCATIRRKCGGASGPLMGRSWRKPAGATSSTIAVPRSGLHPAVESDAGQVFASHLERGERGVGQVRKLLVAI